MGDGHVCRAVLQDAHACLIDAPFTVELHEPTAIVEESKIRRSEAAGRVRRHALRPSVSQRITETSSTCSRAVRICDSLTACWPAGGGGGGRRCRLSGWRKERQPDCAPKGRAGGTARCAVERDNDPERKHLRMHVVFAFRDHCLARTPADGRRPPASA